MIEGAVDVVITDWGLQSYLDLTHRGTIRLADYTRTIRPDVLLLKDDKRSDPRFQNPKFWSQVFAGGFKMKWHNLGPQQVQLRLTVAILNGETYLCGAYVKRDAQQEKRELAKFKRYVNLIGLGGYTRRGLL